MNQKMKLFFTFFFIFFLFSEAHAVRMNFPNTTLKKLVEHMNRITGRNFIFDPGVLGGAASGPSRFGAKPGEGPTITILAPEEMTVEEAYRVFLTALEMKGLTIIPSGKFLKIVSVSDALGQGVKPYKQDDVPDADTYVTRIYHVKHINAKEIELTLETIMGGGPNPRFASPSSTRIVAYESTNSLFITGPGTAVNRIMEMIHLLDQKTHEVKMRSIEIKHANASEIADQLEKIFDVTEAQAPTVRTYRGRTVPDFDPRSGAVIKKIVPDQRTNTLIVFANQEGFQRIEEMIQKLDVESGGVSGQVHIYYFKNAVAKEVEKSLTPILRKAQDQQQQLRNTRGAPFPGGGQSEPTNPIFKGDVQISADDATNSLIITATASDYSQLLEIIKGLDVQRKQVYVEAVIADLSLDKTKSRGLSYNTGLPIGGGAVAGVGLITEDLANFLMNPASLRGGVVIGRSGGTYTITNPTGTTFTFPTVTALLKYLETSNEADILQTPQLLAMDNTEAIFRSSSVYPRQTTTVIGTPGTPQQQPLDRDEVKIELKITPRINETNEYIQLKIEQRIEDVNQNIPDAVKGLAGVSTINRFMQNEIVVRNEDTVVLGGLMRDNVSEAESKIPFLGDIPLLGWLFKSKSRTTNKTSLLLFLTPYIVDSPAEFRKIFDRKLGERREFIKKNFGGADTKKDQIHKMNPPILTPPEDKEERE
ncbi:MAG: type II secretion system secretin GspD [Deltaproteobacteria bacterium]|nr:type II secretion system secretin GspD [Deltaproteobacteria bacterium]